MIMSLSQATDYFLILTLGSQHSQSPSCGPQTRRIFPAASEGFARKGCNSKPNTLSFIVIRKDQVKMK